MSRFFDVDINFDYFGQVVVHFLLYVTAGDALIALWLLIRHDGVESRQNSSQIDLRSSDRRINLKTVQRPEAMISA